MAQDIKPRSQESASGKEHALRDLPGSRLKGHIAVVTGSDSGIGQAIAIAFAKEGADVAIPVHEDEAGASETRQQVEDAGRRATTFRLDQRKRESVRAFFEHVRSELGVPTLLVNNAGIDSTGKNVVDMPEGAMENEIATNFLGPFYCTQEFLQALDLDGPNPPQASIVNVTSVHQEIPRAGAAGYDCAKGALRNLTNTLALELGGKGVRVNTIAPGMVLTPFNQQAREDPKELEKASKSIPMKRPAQPSEIARAALFLASDDASYVHGATLFVDGGLRHFMGQGA